MSLPVHSGETLWSYRRAVRLDEFESHCTRLPRKRQKTFRATLHCSRRDLSWRFRSQRQAPDEQRNQHLWRTYSANGPPQLVPQDARARARHELRGGKVEATGELGRMCWPEGLSAAFFLDDSAQAVDGPAGSCRAADLTRWYGQTRKSTPSAFSDGLWCESFRLNCQIQAAKIASALIPESAASARASRTMMIVLPK